jgi:hypothetical protein
VFHLSYQESFWMDEEIREGSKSSKSKAKKLKQKEKQKLKKASAVGASTALGFSSSSSSTNLLEEDSNAKSLEILSEDLVVTSMSSLEIGQQKSFDELFPEEEFDDSDGDLVDFLQETGSILALADKLGIK